LPCPALDTGVANFEEDELCGLSINGGCNGDPGLEVFTEINSDGDIIIIHGIAWADPAERDTDWYRLTIDSLIDVNKDGMVDVAYSVVSEMPIAVQVLRDLSPTCESPPPPDDAEDDNLELVGNTALGQSCICTVPGVGTVALTDVLYVIAFTADADSGFFDGFPCVFAEGPTFGNNYLLSVDVTDNGVPSPQECSGAAVPCPWDCQAVPDGAVGINDFLGLLAQWGSPGTCDFDGGGVGINDFLDLLAHWGACP